MERDEKIEELRALAGEDPGDELTWFMLGTELARAGRHGEAAEALGRCIEINPDHTAAYRWLGDAYRALGDRERARRAYERAIAVAERTGDLQVAKEARAFLKKME